MANKKTTELPENTTVNDNDKYYHVTSDGISKFIRYATIKAAILQDVSTGNENSMFRGYKEDEAAILAITDPIDGNGAVNKFDDTFWIYVELDVDGNPLNEWVNTGAVATPLEIDAYPTIGNTDHIPSSHGTAELIAEKADLGHGHSMAETWLIEILANYLLSSSFDSVFWVALKAAMVQGAGVTIVKDEATKTVTITAIGADGEPITISPTVVDGDGNAVSGEAVYEHTKNNLQIPIWQDSTLDGTTRTLDFNNSYAPRFEISPAGDEAFVFDNVPSDLIKALDVLIVVNYTSIAEYTAGLPALSGGAVHGESGTDNIITEIPLPTGKDSGYKTEIWGYRKADGGYNWVFGESGGELTGDIDIEDVTGLQAALDAKADTSYVDSSVDAAVVGLYDDRGNYDASGNVFPSSGGSGTAGAILKGDIWTISVAGTLGGTAVIAGQTVRAKVDTPGSTTGNWAISVGSTAISDASETVAGKVEESTDAEMTAFTGTGGTGARLFIAPDRFGIWWASGAKVLAVVLTGLSTATNAVITSADTVLTALGKLQSQISDFLAGFIFSALVDGSSVTLDFNSKKKVNRTWTIAGGTRTLSFSNTSDGAELDIRCTLSSITAVTITLAGSGLTFYVDGVAGTILTYGGASGSIFRIVAKVEGTKVDIWTSNPDVILNNGNTLNGPMNIKTLDANDVVIGANSVDKIKAISGGAVEIYGGGTGTATALNVTDSSKTQSRFKVLDNGQTSITGVVNLRFETAGSGIAIKEGSNAMSGVAVLVGGTVTVSTTKVTANSRIQLTPQNLGTVTDPKAVGVSARTVGTSFTIKSADATDTSSIAWTIIEGI